MICYEYPLSERIRTMLRLEDLCDKVQHFASNSHSADHHVALLSLFEILEVASRADVKSDLLLELDRQKSVLEALRGNPAIREDALAEVLGEIDQTAAELLKISGRTGQELRDNDWLMGIKQRTSIPGGVCEFDLPSYHYWLHQDVAMRRGDLGRWLAPFLPLRNGLGIVLRLLRNSGKSSRQVASGGMFQQMMGGRAAQMLRIRVEQDGACVPEVSANKHAINIRFVDYRSAQQRPRVCELDVPFELTLCNL